MINTYLSSLSKAKDSLDAIMIIDSGGIIEYSALLSNSNRGFVNEGFVGKHILDVYPSLGENTSSHLRVMKSGKAIINERQSLTDYMGNQITIVNSTFPIYKEKEVVGTFETTTFINSNILKTFTKNIKSLYSFDDIITNDSEMIRIKNTLIKLAPTENSVLISGETGTGKELFAEAMHYHSLRSSGPFISINVSAIPENLLESTLFGTTKGSYTGAVDKIGIFEEASGGTLFLDELDSMDRNLQSKLLRAIETKKIRRLGGSKDIDVDVRFISAMNVDIDETIKSKKLRIDLFFRLAASRIHIPSLYERVDDISILAHNFLADGFELSSNVDEILKSYIWPGNVRELKNTINYAISMSTSNIITKEDLPMYIKKGELDREGLSIKDEDTSLADMTAEFEKEIIIDVLKNSRTLTEASAKVKITRQALRYKMNKYGIKW